MFAVCLNYPNIPELKTLPAGNYLCANCTAENRLETIAKLSQIAQDKYGSQPQFIVQQIMISGILQWHYQIQIYVGKSAIKAD